MSSQQLTLNVSLRDGFRFASFFVDKPPGNSVRSNHEVVSVLKAFVSGDDALHNASRTFQQNLLWGEKNTGKTHLLQSKK